MEMQNEAAELVGAYRMGDGDAETLELRADGVAIMAGEAVPWAVSQGCLALGPEMVPYRLEGGTLWLNMGMMQVPWSRVGGPARGATARPTDHAPADSSVTWPPSIPDEMPNAGDNQWGGMAAPAGDDASILGAWESPQGSMVFRPDGTVTSNGEDANYTFDGKLLKLIKGQSWLRIPYRFDGDKLMLGSGPSVTFTRPGIPGVWVGEESCLDPGLYMSRTIYLTLLPNGTVSFAKSESGASRQQITECLERFRYFQEGRPGVQVAGSWQVSGATIAIQFNWQPQPIVGEIDVQSMKMSLPGMGQLPGNEGAAMLFVRSL